MYLDQDSRYFCFGMPGSIAPFYEWDPLNLAGGKTYEEIRFYREAELVHSRVAMLAVAGFFAQDRFHPMAPALKGSAILWKDGTTKLPLWMWFSIFVVSGAVEALRIQATWSNPFDGYSAYNPNDREVNPVGKLKYEYIYGAVPGNLGFDPLGLKPNDPEAFRSMQNKELSNGRLAMLAAAGIVAQEVHTGQAWSVGAKMAGWPF